MFSLVHNVAWDSTVFSQRLSMPALSYRMLAHAKTATVIGTHYNRDTLYISSPNYVRSANFSNVLTIIPKYKENFHTAPKLSYSEYKFL